MNPYETSQNPMGYNNVSTNQGTNPVINSSTNIAPIIQIQPAPAPAPTQSSM